jgi:hypothetical protein
MSTKNAARKTRKPLNTQGANALWNLLDIGVEQFRQVIRVHEEHTFLGYAYVRVNGRARVPGLEFLKFGVVNCAVKLWNDGRVTVQFPEHARLEAVEVQGETLYRKLDEHDGDFAPGNAETRACIELAIRKDSKVIAAVAAGAEARTAASQESVNEDDESAFTDDDLILFRAEHAYETPF